MAMREWGGSLHLTFRLLPTPSNNLKAFLESDGLAPAAVLAKLPYEARRGTNATATARRYRDGRQLYQTAGFLCEDAGHVRVTELGTTLARWLDIMNDKNVVLLGRHAAYALAACQLRNPSETGSGYDPDVEVFPFSFIWRAMLELEGRISSEELDRSIFRVTNADELKAAIVEIQDARGAHDPTRLGARTLGDNDRIIPWMSLASFGWTLIDDKRTTGTAYYQIHPGAVRLLRDAVQIRHKHRDFPSVRDYVTYVSDAAALPPDLR